MADYDVHFSPPTVANVVNVFEHTTSGQQATSFIASNFYSVTDMMHHTTPIDGGRGSVVHLLTGDNLVFDNLSKPRLRNIARIVTEYFEGNSS